MAERITFNGKDASNVSKEDLAEFCEKNRDAYIRGFDSIDDGLRQWDCLIYLVESGSVDAASAHEHGMSDQQLEIGGE